MSLRVLPPMVLLALMAAPFEAQSAGDAPAGSSKVSTQRWRFGMVLTANGSAFRNITAKIAVPMDWPEQRVKVVDEDVSRGAEYSLKSFPESGRLMMIRVRQIAPGAEVRAVLTFEIKRLYRPAPEATDAYALPDPKKLDRKLAPFLAPSPYIDSKSPEIQGAARQIGAEDQKAWDRVKAIYDWVREKIQFEDNRGKEVLSAVEALRAGKGDCDEITSLFVAVCRASKIPARTVRVPGHVYPEFYLLDDQGEGHWFPCQSAGTPSFGHLPDLRPILQKGDNVLVDESSGARTKKTRDRFFRMTVSVGAQVGSGGSLVPREVCEMEK